MLRTGLLTIIVGLAVLSVATGCAVAPTPSDTPTLPATSIPEPTPTSSPTPTPFPPCDSSQFMVPMNVITNGKFIDYATVLPDPTPWPSGLSVQLDVISGSVQYAESIPIRLSITNEKNEPIIFVRPQGLSFYGDFVVKNNSLVVDLRFASGDLIKSDDVSTGFPLVVHAPSADAFSILSLGASCRMDVSLVWNKMNSPLAAPIPGGTYQIKTALFLRYSGPEIPNGASEYVDIGAWVGFTDYSNTVTFTVLLPEK